MLKITVPLSEAFDTQAQKFVVEKGFELELEHSLVSLSKWESREMKPFLGKDEKTGEEVLRYVGDMILTPMVPEDILSKLSKKNLDDINKYINAEMTATTFREIGPNRPSREIITAEIIYYWMVSLQIDWQAQYWHLNRLITLVRVCNEKNKPAKKQKFTRQHAASRAEMNRQRQQQYGTRG